MQERYRSGGDIIDEVRSYGADLRADHVDRYVYPTAPIPLSLVREIHERRMDLLAVFEEFGGENLMAFQVVACAEGLLQPGQVTPTKRNAGPRRKAATGHDKSNCGPIKGTRRNNLGNSFF